MNFYDGNEKVISRRRNEVGVN